MTHVLTGGVWLAYIRHPLAVGASGAEGDSVHDQCINCFKGKMPRRAPSGPTHRLKFIR